MDLTEVTQDDPSVSIIEDDIFNILPAQNVERNRINVKKIAPACDDRKLLKMPYVTSGRSISLS